MMAAVAMSFAPFLPALAGEADVVSAKASREAAGTWRLDVSVRHDDEGWSHYADRWDVIAPDGRVLGSRILLHPHEIEQPFTRSLGGLEIPGDVRRVIVRAHDNVDGQSGRDVIVEVPSAAD